MIYLILFYVTLVTLNNTFKLLYIILFEGIITNLLYVFYFKLFKIILFN
jgi:hypothetical protein